MIHRHPSELMFLKPPSGVGRGHGRRSKGKAEPSKAEPVKAGGTRQAIEMIDETFNASAPGAFERLREMAQRGEAPYNVIGSNDDRARFFEEFDRLYDTPPGELANYKVTQQGSRTLFLEPEYEYFKGGRGEVYVHLPHKYAQASEAEKSGAIKHAIFTRRWTVEDGVYHRAGGYPSYEMKWKYGAGPFSDAKKAQIDKEIKDFMEGQIFKSPLTQEGQRRAENYWERRQDGWYRPRAES